jgi:fido (protein-threonine AMPylation protein)
MSTESELRDWRGGQTNAERLCAGLLTISGYTDVDPQAPLGGPDGKKDIIASRDGVKRVAAVFFPPTLQSFAQVRRKFLEDYEGVGRNGAEAFVFFYNQHLTLDERVTLRGAVDQDVDLFHLERIRLLLDSPRGYGYRLEHLGIAMTPEDQLSFVSESNRSIGRRLRLTEQRMEDVLRKLDRTDEAVGRTTLAVESLITSIPSSLTTPLAPSESVEVPMAELTINMLSLIHRLVMDASGPDQPAFVVAGQLRSVQSFIGSPDDPQHTPPRPEEVPRLLAELVAWWQVEYARLALSPRDQIIEGLACLHHRFLTIHPFLDGNGRVARVLIDQAAQELLGQRVGRELFAENPGTYYETLRAANAGDLRPLVSLLSAALM